jgi:uncharacterized protein
MATTKSPVPRRIDVAALASRGEVLQGRTPLKEMPRLCDAGDDRDGVVEWSVRGSRLSRPGGEAVIGLELDAATVVQRACQRCLEPLRVALHVNRCLHFVRGEDEAARLDAEGDEDFLALQPALDLVELIEDELLLALPIVPRHDHCIELGDLGAAGELSDDAGSAAPHPFAALAGLKVRPGGSKH